MAQPFRFATESHPVSKPTSSAPAMKGQYTSTRYVSESKVMRRRYSSARVKAMRRLACLPARVSLLAMGRLSP